MTDMPFQIGSLVECIDGGNGTLLENNKVYTVVCCDKTFLNWYITVADENGQHRGWLPYRFRPFGNDYVYPYIVAIRPDAPTTGFVAQEWMVIRASERTIKFTAMNDADAITQIMKLPDIRNGWVLKTPYGRTVGSWGVQ